jgi:23S rRNA pseudouridine1911/1915/1917 synthase
MDTQSSSSDGFVEIEYVVEANYRGWRLDKYLCEKIRRLSRNRVQEIIENDLISDRKLKPSTLVTAGLTFRLRKKSLREPETPTSFEEIHRDETLLVVNKPAGLPMHPSARYHHGTLVFLLRARYGPEFRADPAHRLDRETSGLVVCARTTEASRILMRAFVRGEVKKEYLAICEGHVPEDEFQVDAPIAEGGTFIRIAVRIDGEFGKRAQTDFRVVRRFVREGTPFTLLRAFPRTGRQHQIRAHLKHVGFPIVGDKIYGPDEEIFDRFSKQSLQPEDLEKLRLPRHALHAAKVTLTHPSSCDPVSFEALLPPDLEGFLATDDEARPPRGVG